MQNHARRKSDGSKVWAGAREHRLGRRNTREITRGEAGRSRTRPMGPSPRQDMPHKCCRKEETLMVKTRHRHKVKGSGSWDRHFVYFPFLAHPSHFVTPPFAVTSPTVPSQAGLSLAPFWNQVSLVPYNVSLTCPERPCPQRPQFIVCPSPS